MLRSSRWSLLVFPQRQPVPFRNTYKKYPAAEVNISESLVIIFVMTASRVNMMHVNNVIKSSKG